MLFVQMALGAKVAHAEACAHGIEAVPQDMQQAVLGAAFVEGLDEGFLRVVRHQARVLLPGLGLGFLHKAQQGLFVQCCGAVVGVRALGQPALRGRQRCLDVGLKLLLRHVSDSLMFLFCSTDSNLVLLVPGSFIQNRFFAWVSLILNKRTCFILCFSFRNQ